MLLGNADMPIISRFLGILITMYYSDHDPPHFHAKYGDYEVSVTIRDGVISGRFPRRALQHVVEWSCLHTDQLLDNWELSRERKPLRAIDPLE